MIIRDLPELDIVLGIARFTEIPPKMVVRKTLSKAGHSYFTFITEAGAEKILAYINERLASGETLTHESPVIAPTTKYIIYRGRNKEKKFLTTAIITKQVRKAMRPRFTWRPYDSAAQTCKSLNLTVFELTDS
ncbi:MAG: hypothetical protein KGI08_05040 [Thaumarchaeota archaeon]|nr:hypothetical protein [Nitrososphaerota archaeon]